MGNPRHLYIIGNGFDLYHGAKTSYADFRRYLLHYNVNVVKSLEFFFGPHSLRNTVERFSEFRWYTEDFKHLRIKAPETEWVKLFLWKDFERYLSSLNREKIFDTLEWSLPRTKFQKRVYHTENYQNAINKIFAQIDLCTFEMRYQFHKWIRTIQYARGYKEKLLDVDVNAVFLCFNHTTFLEDVYSILPENIKYIHGCKRDKYGSLVLGHSQDYQKGLDEWIHKNKNRKRYRQNLKDQKGRYYGNYKLSYLAYFMDSSSKANWITEERRNAVIDVKDSIEGYYQKSLKDSTSIIYNNREFFTSLRDVESITILGHSLGEVDRNYFKAIIDSNREPQEVKWTFSWYSDGDKERIAKFNGQFGLRNVNYIHMG